MKRVLAIVALAVAWGVGGICRAGALDPGTVAADAKWLIHIDFDALRESKVVQHARDGILKLDRAKEILAKVQEMTGMDPEKDVHGVTAYGNSFKPHTGVLIVYAHMDRQKLIGLMKTRPDFKTTTDDDLEFYSFSEGSGDDHKHTVVAAFPKNRVAVFAGSAEQVKGAIIVLDGNNGLTRSSPLFGDAPKGTILRLSVTGIGDTDLPVKVDMLKKISQVSLAVGESDGSDFNHIRVTATDADAAKEFKSIVDGVKAMVELRLNENADLKKMIDDTKIDTDGKTLSIDWTGSADDVIKMTDKASSEFAKQIRERVRERRANRDTDKKEADKKDSDK